MYPRVRRQVGNAVPPLAAEAIVVALADVLAQAGVRPRSGKELSAARRSRMYMGERLPSQLKVAGQ